MTSISKKIARYFKPQQEIIPELVNFHKKKSKNPFTKKDLKNVLESEKDKDIDELKKSLCVEGYNGKLTREKLFSKIYQLNLNKYKHLLPEECLDLEDNTNTRKRLTSSQEQMCYSQWSDCCAGHPEGCTLIPERDSTTKPCTYYEQDHIVALSLGGQNNIKNFQPLCYNCHWNKTTVGKLLKSNNDVVNPKRKEWYHYMCEPDKNKRIELLINYLETYYVEKDIRIKIEKKMEQLKNTRWYNNY